MAKIMGKSLVGRNVVSDKGAVIGRLLDLSLETVSGKIMMLIIKPGRDVDPARFRLTESKEILIPYTAVKAVKDVVIVNESGVPRT